ncbi:MAG: serine hydrolase, partial [Phycisphaerales bacterium]
ATLAGSTGAFAQIDPSVTTPVGYYVLLGASDAEINTIRATGYRIIDIDRIASGQYDCVLVQNTGDYYNANATWYPSITASSLSAALGSTSRLIDLQAYDSAGTTMFTAVTVGNTGDDAVPGWGWLYSQTSTGAIDSWMSSNSLRPINLQRYTIGGVSRYLGVAISNTGAAAATNIFDWDVALSDVAAPDGFFSDVELHSQGNLFSSPTFNVIRVNKPIRSWSYRSALNASEILTEAAEGPWRPIDVERYTDQFGATKFFCVYVDNSNPIEYRIRQMIRNSSNGDIGLFLKEVGGPTLAQVNADFKAEPASTMKIVHAARAVQRCAQGLDSLDNFILNDDTQNPDECPNGTSALPLLESVRSVVTRMMRRSDNNATLEIAQRCGGNSALNSWTDSIGLPDINNNHTLGCLCGNTPNEITARQICSLYEKIANNTLFSEQWEQELFSMMLNREDDGLANFNSIISQESSGLGLTSEEIYEFIQHFFWAYKAGSYGCSPNQWRSQAGYVRIPFKNSQNTVYFREYTGCTFTDAGTMSTETIVYSAWWELFREQIRAALETWGVQCYPPVITDQPNSATVSEGDSVSFAVEVDVNNRDASYLWRRGSTNIANGFVGLQTTLTLNLSNVSEAQEGEYTCRISHSCGTTTTVPVTLTVNPVCRADVNRDGGVDGDDVIEFFTWWDVGTGAGDFNRDGGIDGDDVIEFFARWDFGC